MPQHGLGLDHVVLLVADLDAAARPFSEAGFHVGPRGRHPHLGTINRLIMFDGPYVELLSVETPTAANARYRHMLQTLGHGWGLALSAKGV